jgi:hypothetical protein
MGITNKVFIEMDLDEWFDKYKPIKNHIDETSSFDGHMFETYGEEVEFVKAQEESRIWMYGDGDDGEGHIWNGWHYINRIGYFITEVPCPADTDIQVNLNDYYYFCENCHEEWEGNAGHLVNDTLGEIDKCPACATMEEIKEYEYSPREEE